MFYDEQGKHVRAKKEMLDGEGNIRRAVRSLKKGEVYECQLFSVKDTRFKTDGFLDKVGIYGLDKSACERRETEVAGV